VASGRDYYGVRSVLDPLDIKCSAILGNGAQYCNKEGKTIMDCYLDKEMLKEILPVFIENHTPYMIFTEIVLLIVAVCVLEIKWKIFYQEEN